MDNSTITLDKITTTLDNNWTTPDNSTITLDKSTTTIYNNSTILDKAQLYWIAAQLHWISAQLPWITAQPPLITAQLHWIRENYTGQQHHNNWWILHPAKRTAQRAWTTAKTPRTEVHQSRTITQQVIGRAHQRVRTTAQPARMHPHACCEH